MRYDACWMTFRKLLAIVLGSLLVLVSCVIESKDNRPGGPGETCVDGTTCRPGLMCFVEGNDPESGTCTEPPSACAGDPSCDCFQDELAPDCASEATDCFILLDDMTASCGPTRFRRLDETCSLMRPCEPGLLCLIPDEGVPGSCEPGPDCPDLDCDCLFELAEDACPNDAHGCFIVDDVATLHCYI